MFYDHQWQQIQTSKLKDEQREWKCCVNSKQIWNDNEKIIKNKHNLQKNTIPAEKNKTHIMISSIEIIDSETVYNPKVVVWPCVK